jgi:uncharacterized membrane protein YphA (DoxX/SURF4 family)
VSNPISATATAADTAERDTTIAVTMSTATGTAGTTWLILMPIRIFLAVGWLRCGIEKLGDGQWWDGTQLRSFVVDQRPLALPWFRPFLELLVAPAPLVSFVVMVTEIGCGVAIAVGRPLRAALRWGVVLNTTIVLAGVVNPSAFYLIMQIVLLFAIAEGTIGAHRSVPTSRTLCAAGLCATAATVVLPSIRTLRPAGVITDAAAMLAFFGVVSAVGLCIRWAAADHVQRPAVVERWARRVSVWGAARAPAPRQR